MKGTILEKILESKLIRVEEAKRAFQTRIVEPKAVPNRFREALRYRSKPNIIAEFKRASPSRGVINDGVGPVEAAMRYGSGGAAAISIVTEEDFFNGSLDDLRAVRTAIDLPILRKDFIIDEFQIIESATVGADAILLIVAALNIDDLRRFQSLALELGLDALVEVHNREELEIATNIGATLIGVNNRNLKTFEVSLDVSRDLIEFAPSGSIMVTESGITTRQEIDELSARGYSGFLIGETLMRRTEALNELSGAAR